MREKQAENLIEAARQAIDSTWLFIESGPTLDGPPVYEDFFLCKGDRIIASKVSLRDWLSPRFPDNVLIENNNAVTLNGAADQAALVRLNYEKWKADTLAGRVYSMKCKMEVVEQLKDSNPEEDFQSNLQSSNPSSLILRQMTLLREDFKLLKNILIVIAILLAVILWKIH